MSFLNTICIVIKNNIVAIQILLFAGILCSLWIIEHSFSNKSFNDKLKHAYCNLLFILAVLPVQLLISLVAVLISKWVAEHHWGLLYLIPLSKNIYLKYLFGFLILDFLDYIYHIMMHKTTMLWKFHQVHHADTFVDVSTTLREHPGETFVRVCFLCLWIFLSGASLGLLIIRQMAQTIANIIAHTELKLPSRTEKMLGLVFVTPHIHSIHHHDKMPYTD